MPKVSVIVPNYNHAAYLHQRISSILDQTFQDFDVLLLDDCSTDNSRDIIEQYQSHPQVSKIIINKENGGTSYKQWAKGIEHAKGELIWIAESDDWCDNIFLESLVPYFSDQKVVLAFVHTRVVNDNTIEPLNQNNLIPQIDVGLEFVKSVMLTRNYIFNASMVLFRKSTYEKVKNSAWVDMKLAGDWFLWIQILKEGKYVEVFKELNYCRRHGNNLTNKFRRQGYDFIEGLEVLKMGKGICKNNINKKEVYLSWIKLFNYCKEIFDPKVKRKVITILLKEDLLFCYYYLYDFLRRKYRTINFKK